jgi:hypothetical protein
LCSRCGDSTDLNETSPAVHPLLATRLVRCVSQVATRRTTTCALLGLFCASCNSTSSPESYVDLTMEPREFNIAVGVSGPLTITYLVTTSSGRGAAVPASEVSLSVRDTFYAVVRKDTIFTRRVGTTYLRAEYRPPNGRRLRDSVPIIILELR